MLSDSLGPPTVVSTSYSYLGTNPPAKPEVYPAAMAVNFEMASTGDTMFFAYRNGPVPMIFPCIEVAWRTLSSPPKSNTECLYTDGNGQNDTLGDPSLVRVGNSVAVAFVRKAAYYLGTPVDHDSLLFVAHRAFNPNWPWPWWRDSTHCTTHTKVKHVWDPCVGVSAGHIYVTYCQRTSSTQRRALWVNGTANGNNYTWSRAETLSNGQLTFPKSPRLANGSVVLLADTAGGVYLSEKSSQRQAPRRLNQTGQHGDYPQFCVFRKSGESRDRLLAVWTEGSTNNYWITTVETQLLP